MFRVVERELTYLVDHHVDEEDTNETERAPDEKDLGF